MANTPPSKAKTRSSRDKVRAHRARLRKQGLRPIQIWVPDVNSEAYKAEVRRQCLDIANSPQEKEDQDFVESLFEWDEV
jgi:hypothetical protein